MPSYTARRWKGQFAMVPNTERFELRLDPGLLAMLDQWRSKHDGGIPSRAEAIRRLIEAGVAPNRKEEFRPSHAERLIINLLTKVLKQNNETRKEAELISEALYSGHFWYFDQRDYRWLMHDDIDDPRSLSFVIDVLDMWQFIEPAYAKLPALEKKRVDEEAAHPDPRFIGFDGNGETEHMSIARFLVEKLGDFSWFKGRDFNSHTPMVLVYERMSAKFELIRPKLIGRELNADELIEILKRGNG
jgi:uncharacterized protein YfbU (UPF0304 family)